MGPDEARGCNEYTEEIQSIGGRLEPHTDAAALGNMLYETFRASFGTRSFRCTPEECEAGAERVFEKVQRRGTRQSIS